MKPPSPRCLNALRSLAYENAPRQCFYASRRAYVTVPDKSSQSSPPKPGATPPPPAVKQPAQSPGFRQRSKRDDDEDFVPQPLSRPIGMPNPPQPGENMGMDKRSLRQRRDDFVNYEKHIERRAKMTKQIAKPYFRDWSNMRFHKGKSFIANERLFRAEHALYLPNFHGKTLRRDAVRREGKDGYKGLGRDTAEVMPGKVSVVSVFSSQWAQSQVETFLSQRQNPALHEILASAPDITQTVQINVEMQTLKWWILQLFVYNLRKGRSLEQQERYFMVRRGISDIMKEAIGYLNDKVGYVYLVDQECKIRWAGSAIAQESERQSLNKGLKRLIQEAKTPVEKRADPLDLEAAVAEVVEEAPRASAAAA